MGCIRVVLVLVFLGIALGSIAILISIGGQSDGPGALVFYIGAFVGLFGAWTVGTAGSGAARPRR